MGKHNSIISLLTLSVFFQNVICSIDILGVFHIAVAHIQRLMEVVIPAVMALLIDRGIDAHDMGEIWKYGIILIACAALALISGAAAGTYAARASTGFARNLRHDMYYAVQDYSFANIDPGPARPAPSR